MIRPEVADPVGQDPLKPGNGLGRLASRVRYASASSLAGREGVRVARPKDPVTDCGQTPSSTRRPGRSDERCRGSGRLAAAAGAATRPQQVAGGRLQAEPHTTASPQRATPARLRATPPAARPLPRAPPVQASPWASPLGPPPAPPGSSGPSPGCPPDRWPADPSARSRSSRVPGPFRIRRAAAAVSHKASAGRRSGEERSGHPMAVKKRSKRQQRCERRHPARAG